MRPIRVWAMLLGIAKAVVEAVEVDDRGSVIVSVRPRRRRDGSRGKVLELTRGDLHGVVRDDGPG